MKLDPYMKLEPFGMIDFHVTRTNHAAARKLGPPASFDPIRL